MNSNIELVQHTKKLLEYTDFISTKFEEVKNNKVQGNFFKEVKPFADEVREVANMWKKSSVNWISEARPKNLHINQIESAYDQLETISVQVFYPETSRTRFINLLRSVQYILMVLLETIQKYKED